jgi:radical SAM-linked protein
VFIPHLGVIEVFASSIIRSGVPACYTEGFNPLVKIDFASPAPVGIGGSAEIACLDLEQPPEPEDFICTLNKALPGGFTVTRAELFTIPLGGKKYSPASLLWGFRYGDTLVPAREDKAYRTSRQEGTLFGLVRDGILAKPPDADGPEDYFCLYQQLYRYTE